MIFKLSSMVTLSSSPSDAMVTPTSIREMAQQVLSHLLLRGELGVVHFDDFPVAVLFVWVVLLDNLLVDRELMIVIWRCWCCSYGCWCERCSCLLFTLLLVKFSSNGCSQSGNGSPLTVVAGVLAALLILSASSSNSSTSLPAPAPMPRIHYGLTVRLRRRQVTPAEPNPTNPIS